MKTRCPLFILYLCHIYTILLDTYSLDCKMNSEVDASYRLMVNSESSDIMDDPSVSILDVVSYFILHLYYFYIAKLSR